MMNSDQIEKEVLKQAKKLGKLIFKLAAKLIKPYLPLIIIILLIFFMLFAIIAAIYSAFPVVDDKKQLPILAGVIENKEKDEELRENYIKFCNEYNIKDTWVVNEKAIGPSDGNAYEASPNQSFYPGTGVEYIGSLRDSYGNDKKLKLLWGQVHAATLYNAYANNLSEITKFMQKKTAKDLHPYFFYKKSKRIVSSTDEEGKRETTVSVRYLLVEAYTIQGHYQYHYKWKTKTFGSGKNKTTVTEEVLKDVQQILPNKWQRLEDWMKKEYQIDDDSNDLAAARQAVWEAGSGFNEQAEWLEWLISQNLSGKYLSQSTIPPELVPFFKEAEERFGIPWWFLAAVAYKESSFNPQAENAESGCYGLMQISQDNWPVYAKLLNFDPDLDRDNPRAQIFVGAYMLGEQGLKNVNWEVDNWREQTLSVLTFYGGFRGKNAEERCREEYASKIWEYADKFRAGSTRWPVPGYNTITSPFGMRLHPIWGEQKFHSGIDIGAPAGAAVVSAATGRVTFAGWENPNNQEQGYGLYITIRDENYLYLYGHLSALNVKKGDEVNIGDVIGAVGSTGTSTAPHLHFEVRDLSLGGHSGQPIDPMLIFRE